MCGRMTLSRKDLDLVADELEAICPADVVASYRPRWNVAPTDVHPVVRLAGERSEAARTAPAGRRLQLARWGFVGTGKGSPLLINARAETVASRPSFRSAFSNNRCLVPADGFYEWSGKGEARRPTWFHRSDGRLLLLAGLYDPSGRFTVLTTTANALVSRLHDRMPVILTPEVVDVWLAQGMTSEAEALLRPAPEDTLTATAVSRRANSVKNDDPACLEPATEEAEPASASERQLRMLF